MASNVRPPKPQRRTAPEPVLDDVPPAPMQPASLSSEPSSPLVLKVRGLHKWYGSVHALDGVDLDIHQGEVVGFLGPNGAGKTTFTRCVLGFLRPTSGTVELFGKDARTQGREVLDKVGVVPDQYDFYGNLNGRQHLDFYARLYGIPAAQRKQRIDEAIEQTGMQEFALRRVRGYSHGMKQRLCIAQALVNKPQFVIFDEPTNGLDPRGAFETRALIKGLAAAGATVFMSSHILPEVEDVCSRVAILSKGRILVQSSVTELRKKLQGDRVKVTITLEDPSPEVARLVLDRAAAQSATLNGADLVCELGAGQTIPDLVALLMKNGGRIRSVQEEKAGLEEIFLQLTKGEGGV